MDDDMKRTTNRLNHYLGRPSSRQDMKAMSAPNHGKSSLVGADGQLVTAIHQQESTHNQLWIDCKIFQNRDGREEEIKTSNCSGLVWITLVFS